MSSMKELFEKNRAWAEKINARQPAFFRKLAERQSPEYLWIGCSDSRVPATQIVGLMPGELFVHRNIANIVADNDLSCLSVLHYAIDKLKVKHIIVCGHYGCGGVHAAMHGDMRAKQSDSLDTWLNNIKNASQKHDALLSLLKDKQKRWDRLCELNVIEQVMNVCRIMTVQDAWARGQELTVHGLIYGLQDGLLRDLNLSIASPDKIKTAYTAALSRLPANA